MSILWSAGTAAFEPIHIEGEALTNFEQTARRARQALADAVLGGNDGELVNIGRDLHARFFAGGVGVEVAGWLRSLDNVESLEIGTDAPGRIPFALFDDPERPGAWGRRFPLTVGHRVSPLRTFGQLPRTNVLVVVDAELRDSLNDANRAVLDRIVTQVAATVVGSREHLKEAITQNVPDVVWMLARLEGGAWVVGGERMTPQELRATIRGAEDGNPLPVVVSTGVAGADAVTSWECFLSAATGSLPGLVAIETPANASAACDIGVSLLSAFLVDKLPIARALQQVRLGAGAIGLSFATFTPPRVRVAREGDADTPRTRPLPDAPYHPLRPLDREDRALLFGREDDIEACAVALDQPNVAGLLIHGRGGVGKASLVRAGLLPFLEEENRGFYVLRDRTEAADSEFDQPTIALRTGPDLAGSLIMGLTAFADRPFTYTTPTGRTVTVDLPAIVFGSPPSSAIQDFATGDGERGGAAHRGNESLATTDSPPHDTAPRGADAPRSPAAVWDKVHNDPAALADLFDRATRDLPFDLLIPLEQLEDTIVLAASKEDDAAAVLAALAKSPGRFHVVATLRTECLGEIQPLLGADYSRAAWKDYLLDELSAGAVSEALLAPTKNQRLPYADGSPATRYEFQFEPGTATTVMTYVKEQIKTSGYTAIQLVHAFGGVLYDECVARGQGAARPSDVARVVKKGAVESLVESKIKAVGGGDTRALRQLIGSLHRVNGRVVTRDLVPLETIERSWRSAVPAKQVLNLAVERGPMLEAHELLVGGRKRIYVAAPQDLLANYGEQQDRLKGQQKFAKSKVLDSLFLFVPLTVLAMAIGFFVLSKFRATRTDVPDATKKNSDVELTKKYLEGRQDGAAATRFAIYSGALAQADAAMQQGNTLRARQWLMTQQPQVGDVRGFEWFYLWKKISGEEASLVGHKAQTRLLAMSPDGKWLASGDEGGNVLLWSLNDFKEPLVANLKGLKGAVVALAIAPDGSEIAASDGGAKVQIWDASKPGKTVADVEPKATLTTEGKAVTCLVFLGTGSLAVGDEDKSVTLFDLAEKKAKWTARDHTAAVRAVTTFGDGSKLASGSDKELIVWTSAGKKAKSEVFTGGTIVGLANAPTGNAVVAYASLGSSGGLYVWNPDGKLTQLSADLPGANAVAVVPGTKLIAAAGQDQVVRLLADAPFAKQQQLLGHVSAVRSVAGGGNKLASVGYDNSIKIWNVAKIVAERDVIRTGGAVSALAFDPSERILATAGAGKNDKNGLVELWSPSGDKLAEIETPGGPVGCLAFSPRKDALLLAAGVGNDVQTWEVTIDKDAVTTKAAATLKKHAGTVTCLAFAEGGKSLASGGLDKAFNTWSLPDGKLVKTLEVPAAPTSLFFDGKAVVYGDVRGVGAVVDVVTGKAAFPPYQVHGAAINAIVLIKQKGLNGIASVSDDQSFRLWAADRESLKFGTLDIFRGHHQPILSLAQGKGFFATGGQDGTVRFWDYTLPDERYTVNIGSPVRGLALANGRAILAVAGSDQKVRLLRAVPQESYGPANLPAPRNPGHDEE